MAEAFANTVESMANGPNDTPEKRIFYELNSYAIHTKKVNQTLEHVIELLGKKLTFRLIYISYLFSNCLFPELNTKAFHQVLDLIIDNDGLRKKAMDSAHVRRVFNHAFQLSMDFRLQTTGFFCAYSGINTELTKLLNIDIANIYTKTDTIKKFITHFEFIFE
jgi:hypothetical protein